MIQVDLFVLTVAKYPTIHDYIDLPTREHRFNDAVNLLKNNAPSRAEYDTIQPGSIADKALKHDMKTIKYIQNSRRETDLDRRRKIAEGAYFSFKDLGIILSGHAALQYSSRMYRKKTGKLLFNFETVKKIAGMPVNYIDSRNS